MCQPGATTKPSDKQTSSTFLHSVSFKHSEQDNAEDAGLETLRLTKETKSHETVWGEAEKCLGTVDHTLVLMLVDVHIYMIRNHFRIMFLDVKL